MRSKCALPIPFLCRYSAPSAPLPCHGRFLALDYLKGSLAVSPNTTGDRAHGKARPGSHPIQPTNRDISGRAYRSQRLSRISTRSCHCTCAGFWQNYSVSMSQKQKLTEYACGLPAEELSYGLTPVLSALQRVQQASIPAPVLQGSASVHQSGNAETSSSVRPSRGPASSAGASSSA